LFFQGVFFPLFFRCFFPTNIIVKTNIFQSNLYTFYSIYCLLQSNLKATCRCGGHALRVGGGMAVMVVVVWRDAGRG
jgi:hypothetical protein